jgi:hypothetical protein
MTTPTEDRSEGDALLGIIARAFREGAVRRCLSGNDTGCFTVEDYMRAYDGTERRKKDIAECHGLTLSRELAVRHLQSLPDLVREVKPGTWSAV